MPPLRFFHQLLTQQAEPAVVYYVRGTSTNVNGTETFNIQYIKDGASTPDAATTETVQVAADGSWEFSYSRKKIYSLYRFAYQNSTIRAVDFSSADDMTALYGIQEAFASSALQSADFSGKTFAALYNGTDAFYSCASLTSVELSSATFASAVLIRRMFCGTALTSLNLQSATFAVADNVEFLFSENYSLANVALPNATFANATKIGGLFVNDNVLISINLPSATFANATELSYLPSLQLYSFAQNCTSLQSVSLPSATFASLTNAGGMFLNCTALQSVNLQSATFANLVIANGMFQSCGNLTDITWSASLNLSALVTMGESGAQRYAGMFMNCTKLTNSAIAPLSSQTLANVTNIRNAFAGCAALTEINLGSATFRNLTLCMAAFYSCANLQTINLTNATFEKVNDNLIASYPMTAQDTLLTTIITSQQGTAILPTSQPTSGALDFRANPLTYASMLNVANWLSDLTGYSAHNVTFKTSAWNALTAAEQSNIDSILTAKNWTRQLA